MICHEYSKVAYKRKDLKTSHFGKVNKQHLFQSIAEYSCNEGYYIDGHQHRACQVNEEWSGGKPQCKGRFFILL